MAYKDKERQREYQRKLMEKKRKGLTEGLTKQPEVLDSTPQSVRPDVTPTMADVEANKAWVVLTGPNKGEIRWHGPLAQGRPNAPCETVDGVYVADHSDACGPSNTDWIIDWGASSILSATLNPFADPKWERVGIPPASD